MTARRESTWCWSCGDRSVVLEIPPPVTYGRDWVATDRYVVWCEPDLLPRFLFPYGYRGRRDASSVMDAYWAGRCGLRSAPGARALGEVA